MTGTELLLAGIMGILVVIAMSLDKIVDLLVERSKRNQTVTISGVTHIAGEQ